jgi:alanyl-tRNA synthetase
LAKEKGVVIDRVDFDRKMSDHQKLSQTASAGMFKGGLANHNDKTIRLHTAHHLLLAALQHVIGKEVKQRGSNITEERLRIDFIAENKLTDEQKKRVEDWVNDKISQILDVVRREMPLAEAEKLGAEMEFGAKYPETVSVYFIEDKNGNAISKEFCGGPHVTNTKELGHFKILKEEAVAKGIRRIKAILE